MTIVLAGSMALAVGLAVMFGWLALRAWRAQRALIKWPGVFFAGLLALICVAAIGLAVTGLYRVYRPVASPAPDVQIAATPEQVARGERLAHLCIGCHSSSGDLPLDGSSENFLAGMAMLYAPNLTPGGPLQSWSDGEIIRAIREGVHQDGRSLLLMPSDQYRVMSDADVEALVAFLRSQPAVDRQTPENKLNFFGAMLMGTGMFPLSAQPSVTGPVEAPAAGPPPARGEYLVTISGCTECHGENLEGGTSQFVPNGPNLPVILAQWSADEFVQTIRTGVDPYGNAINPERMPWRDYAAAYSDEDLQAIYAYIRTLSEIAGQ